MAVVKGEKRESGNQGRSSLNREPRKMRERRAESRKQRAESGNSIAAKRSKNRLTTDEYSFFLTTKPRNNWAKEIREFRQLTPIFSNRTRNARGWSRDAREAVRGQGAERTLKC